MSDPKLSEDTVRALPLPETGNRVHFFGGHKLQGKVAPSGFGVRVTAGGSKAFVLDYRVNGTKRRFTVGEWKESGGAWSVIAAIDQAQKLRKQVDLGEDPQADKEKARSPEPDGKTVGSVIDDFIKRYAKQKLRTADAVESSLNRLVKPHIGKVVIYNLRRSHVAEMLDKIEDDVGPVAADRARAHLRKTLAWYGERDDEFNLGAAIVRVEPRANPQERARSRILSDDEIRVMWPLLDSRGTFGRLVKTLLLTAQRRSEVAGMMRTELNADGAWEIPPARYKTKRAHRVPLSKAAAKVIKDQLGDDEKRAVVFASSEGTPFSAFGKSKAALDKAILEEMRKAAKEAGHDPESVKLPGWTLHDLRRCAKTLMQRAGVRPDVSERVLGHVISGVEGVYDRHGYAPEMRDAVERLAGLIGLIVNPPSEVVVDFEEANQAAK